MQLKLNVENMDYVMDKVRDEGKTIEWVINEIIKEHKEYNK